MPPDNSALPSHSVVLATLGRREIVLDFLRSVLSQTVPPQEIIIVDQNPTDDLRRIIEQHFDDPLIRHFRVPWQGLARARNFGLGKVSSEWVFFGDDDSTLPDDYFERLLPKPAERGAVAVSTRIVDPETGESMLNQPGQRARVTPFNIHETMCEGATLWHAASLRQLEGYCEDMGLGRYFAAEEGADLAMRALRAGMSLEFDPETTVYHPSKRDSEPARFLAYARGTGYYVRRHARHPAVWYFAAKFVLKNAAGLLISLARPTSRAKHTNRLKGLAQGIHHYPNAPKAW